MLRHRAPVYADLGLPGTADLDTSEPAGAAGGPVDRPARPARPRTGISAAPRTETAALPRTETAALPRNGAAAAPRTDGATAPRTGDAAAPRKETGAPGTGTGTGTDTDTGAPSRTDAAAPRGSAAAPRGGAARAPRTRIAVPRTTIHRNLRPGHEEPTRILLKRTAGSAGAAHSATLTCDPAGGTHPNAAQVCDEIAKAHGNFMVLSSAKKDPRACYMIYSPVRVSAEGRWKGESVHFTARYPNACVMRAQTGSIFDF